MLIAVVLFFQIISNFCRHYIVDMWTWVSYVHFAFGNLVKTNLIIENHLHWTLSVACATRGVCFTCGFVALHSSTRLLWPILGFTTISLIVIFPSSE